MHAHTSLSRGWAGAWGSQISDSIPTLQHECVQRAENSQTIHKLCHGNMSLHRFQWSYNMTSVQEEKLDSSCQCCMRKHLLIQKKKGWTQKVKLFNSDMAISGDVPAAGRYCFENIAILNSTKLLRLMKSGTETHHWCHCHDSFINSATALHVMVAAHFTKLGKTTLQTKCKLNESQARQICA